MIVTLELCALFVLFVPGCVVLYAPIDEESAPGISAEISEGIGTPARTVRVEGKDSLLVVAYAFPFRKIYTMTIVVANGSERAIMLRKSNFRAEVVSRNGQTGGQPLEVDFRFIALEPQIGNVHKYFDLRVVRRYFDRGAWTETVSPDATYFEVPPRHTAILQLQLHGRSGPPNPMSLTVGIDHGDSNQPDSVFLFKFAPA